MQRGMYYWIIILFLSALVFIALAGAEPDDYTVTWNRTYGGPAAGEAAYAIIADPEGTGFFLAGETETFGAGKADAWVVRLTPEGNEAWNSTYGGEEADTARSIIRTGDGNLLVAGTLTLVTNRTRLDTDAWVVKIDPSGSEIWNRTYGGPDVNASANAVIGADDGGIFVGSIAPWERRVRGLGGQAERIRRRGLEQDVRRGRKQHSKRRHTASQRGFRLCRQHRHFGGGEDGRLGGQAECIGRRGLEQDIREPRR